MRTIRKNRLRRAISLWDNVERYMIRERLTLAEFTRLAGLPARSLEARWQCRTLEIKEWKMDKIEQLMEAQK